LIRTTGTIGFTREIVYRGFMIRSSKIVQKELRYHDPRYPDGDISSGGLPESEWKIGGIVSGIRKRKDLNPLTLGFAIPGIMNSR
jgi:hypothetical protein